MGVKCPVRSPRQSVPWACPGLESSVVESVRILLFVACWCMCGSDGVVCNMVVICGRMRGKLLCAWFVDLIVCVCGSESV